jgi:PadR family transcriptional regulator, regulatory protein PadR
MAKQFLGEFEELVLLAIMKLGNEAYGVPIAEIIEDATGKRVSSGALYITLSRLEEKKYISSWFGEKTDERGGKRKKYFAVEIAGKEAINQAAAVRSKLGQELAGSFV